MAPAEPKHVSIYDGHEDRLQRLEDGHLEIVKATVKIVNLKESIETTNLAVKDLSTKIETVIQPIVASITDIKTILVEQKPKIEALEAKDKSRAARKDRWRNAMTAILIGAASIACKELFVAFWILVTKKV